LRRRHAKRQRPQCHLLAKPEPPFPQFELHTLRHLLASGSCDSLAVVTAATQVLACVALCGLALGAAGCSDGRASDEGVAGVAGSAGGTPADGGGVGMAGSAGSDAGVPPSVDESTHQLCEQICGLTVGLCPNELDLAACDVDCEQSMLHLFALGCESESHAYLDCVGTQPISSFGCDPLGQSELRQVYCEAVRDDLGLCVLTNPDEVPMP
jgi:hypothetical protein